MTSIWVAGGRADDTAAPQSGPRAPDTVESLMSQFAESGGVRARFEETRALSILATPIVTRGMLYFAPPDRLARVTTEPGTSKVVVHGTHVTFEDETGRRELDLESSEAARGLVGNLMVLLRGDLSTLRERYTIDYTADASEWTLDLEPRARTLRAMIERVRVKGEGTMLTGMETLETNGDSTVAILSGVEIGLELDGKDGNDVFSLGAPGPGE